MRRSSLLGLVGFAAAVVVGLYALGFLGSSSSGVSASAEIAALATGEVESALGPAEPDDWFISQRAGGPDKTLDEAAFAKAAIRAKDLRGNSSSRRFHGDWTLAGPTNVGGRIVDLVVDPLHASTIYVAAATGGIWKSTDGVVTMVKAWPDDYAQSMGALAIGSNGTLWAGTGEANPGGGSMPFGGNGVYRSLDGGERWKRMGFANSGTTGRIAVDPSDPERIFVAVSGSLFNPGGERGIYRSEDNGRHWTLVLAPETPFAGGVDLPVDPTNPQRIFAAMWDHRREPDLRTYGGTGSGLFRSLDGGDTWTRLTNVTSRTTAATRSPRRRGRAPRAGSAGGSAGSGSIRSTRTTSSRPA